MSQAGPVDLVANTPQIPTMFVTDSGIAVPVANTLDILSSVAAAGTTPIQTTGASNVVTIHAQISQAIAASDATKIGLAAFNSLDFTVDANGFVTFTGAGATETLTGNSGGAVGPTANNINTLGTGSITIVGNPGTSTLTTQLTGLTNHAVLVGAGTATITKVGPSATTGQVLQSQGAGADPAFSTATYPATTTINQILFSSAANTVTGLATANRGVLTTGATGVPVVTALATDGQLIIGSTAGAPAAATLSAGSGITITNASNSITIAVTAGATVVETLTGNSGGAISPTAGNINTLGTGSITIAGAGSTLTTQLTGLTNHSLLVGAGTATITNLGVATNGQLPIGSAGADPVLATLSAGTGISITNGAGSITVATSGTGTVNTLTGNSGGAISPTGGNINTLGTGSITIAGAGSTLTTQLTGLTNHNVLVGAGTATITNVAPGTAGIPLVSNGAASDPSFTTALVVGGGTGSTSFNINGAVFSNTTTTGVLQAATLSSGQLLIGGTTTPAAATLTAGTGVTITNGNNSITVAATGGGLTWSETSGTFTAVAGHGYFITAASTPTLPASPSEGDVVAFAVDTASTCTVTGNTGQKIRIGAALSAAAGTAANNARGDTLHLVYESTGTTWWSTATMGTWTLT